GKAAHAGTHPRDGASAMVALAHKIVAIHGLNDFDRGLTFNSIVTHGGTRSNIIPEHATAEIDIRLPTAALGDEAIARLQAIVGKGHLSGTSAVLEGGVNRPPMETTPGTQALLAIASEVASTLRLPLKATSTGGGSDGNFVTPLGVPVLDGLGAVGGAYHSSDEWLDLSSIPQRAALTALLVWEACRRGEFVR
ncbi:MAG: M20/M25/M40 family metallo-hydrolase, partial [Pseudomonadota bacterium]